MRLIARLRAALAPAPLPAPDPLDDPVFAAMSSRDLADLPLPRPASRARRPPPPDAPRPTVDIARPLRRLKRVDTPRPSRHPRPRR